MNKIVIKWYAACIVLGLNYSLSVFGQSVWTENSFEDFIDGSFLDAGSNCYVSKAGRIQLITRWDFNNDGNLDILLCTSQSHTEKENTYIYLNNGQDIDARSRIEIPGGGSSDGLLTDFNKDGWLDLAVSNFKDSHVGWVNSWVYYGSPEGFSPQRRTVLPAYYATALTAGDFNGDGWQDLAIACQWQKGPEQAPVGDKMSFIYWNSETGFTPDNRLSMTFDGQGATAVASGDLDNDGIDDLIALAAGKTYILHSSRSAFAIIENRVILPIQGNAVAVGDVNNDQIKDLVICTRSTVVVLLGANNGYDTTNSIKLSVARPMDVAIADIDADGLNDIIVANATDADGAPSTNSYIFFSDGKDFSKRAPYPLPTLGAHAVRAADLNGDGLPEIIISNKRVTNQNNLNSYVYWNINGRFHFGHHTQLPTQGSIANTVGDINNDGLLDVIFFNEYGNFQDGPALSHIYWGNGTRNFSIERRTAFYTQQMFGQAHADLNDDGNVDILFSHARFSIGIGHVQSGLVIYWGQDEGFGNPTHLSMRSGYGGARIADINKDGYLDLMAGGSVIDFEDPSKHGFPIYWGSANGYSHANRTIFHFKKDRMRQPLLMDLNKDGWLDIALQEVDGKIKLYWGSEDGYNGAYSLEVDLGRNDHLMYINGADFNKDGWLDLLLPNRGQADGTECSSLIFYGSATGYSKERSIEIPSYVTFQNTIADFDHDGWLDIFLCSYGGEIQGNRPSLIYWGSEEGFLKRPRLELLTYGSSGSEAGDFDGDGWLDLLIANHRKSGSYDQPLPHTHDCPSMIYWGGKRGFTPDNRLDLPVMGPHGLNVRDLGNSYDRGLYEDYISSVYYIPEGEEPISINWEAETPNNTAVKFQIRTAVSKEKLQDAVWCGAKGRDSWFVKNGSKITRYEGRWLQYRARLITPNGGATPYLTSVSIAFKSRKK